MNKFTFHVLYFFLLAASLRAQNFSENNKTTKQLFFKENKGQVSDQFFNPRADILFSGNAGNMAFYLRNSGVSYQLSRIDKWQEQKRRGNPALTQTELAPAATTLYRLDINWVGTASQTQVVKGESLPGYDNYYLASCPGGAVNVRSFTDVMYKNIYPGINLKWYEKNGNLKYDYHVAANADYKKIQFEYKGAETIRINSDGELVITTPLGTLKEQKPVVIQNNKVLPATWSVNGNIVSFDIENSNPSLPLVIDPMVRLWGTYYGGSGNDETFNVSSDPAGNVYMSGETKSTGNIATTGAHQTTLANTDYDAFLVKFNAAGIRQWATYYGGTGGDYGYECNTDANGNVYLIGETESSDPGVIATAGAHQTTFSAAGSNAGDAFLVMFNSAGVRQWGTYYGGDQEDYAWGVSLDNSGNIYLTGAAGSATGIATPGSHKSTLSTQLECFLIKFNTAGVRQWGTYYGGFSEGRDCIASTSGDVYLCGRTSNNTGIATPGCHQFVYGGGSVISGDAFYAKFNTSGVLQWGTYYGGPGQDQANQMVLDASGNLYGAGNCSSVSGTVIASPGSHQPVYGGGTIDGYLVKFDPNGVRQWGTFYGGTGLDVAGAPAMDASGNIIISGLTSTTGGTAIATACAYQPGYGGGSSDMFLAKFTSTGSRIWGTYYGSIYTEDGVGSCTDPGGNVYICGISLANSGTVMASSNGYQPVYGGGPSDAFLAKFDGCIPGTISDLTPPAKLLVCSGNTTTLSAGCGNWYSTAAGTVVLETGGTFTAGPIVSDTTFYLEDFSCGIITGPRTAITITLAPDPPLTVTNSNPDACVGESVVLTASGASTYSWINNPASTPTIQLYVLLYTTYTVSGVNANGCEATETLAVTPNLCMGIQENGTLNPGLLLYPNPNNGSFHLQAAAAVTLKLNNELGQTVREISLTSSNNYTATVDQLENGIYFLTGEKDNRCLNKKIIVIH